MRKSIFPWFLFIFLVLTSCDPAYKASSAQYQNYRITPSQQADPNLSQIIKPYSDSVNKSMNDVVGFNEVSLDKKPTESTLGNFVADALLLMSREKFNMQVDAAFVNYGGIRLNQLPQGSVTRGKIFELMPFDNILVLQKIKGDAFQQFLDFTASKGGWPLSGLTMQIKNGKAVNVMINGKPLDPASTYTIANSDFVANGGDDVAMLKPLPQITVGYLVRDAIFDYIIKLKQQGKNISSKLENRVTNVQ